jgi:hypothetical protein
LVEKQIPLPLVLFLGETVKIFGGTGGDGEPAPHCRTRAKLVEPALEVFELFDVLTLRLPADRPWIADHVRNRVFAAGKAAPVIEPFVEDPIDRGAATWRLPSTFFREGMLPVGNGS